MIRIQNHDQLVGGERIERAVVSIRVEKLVAPRNGRVNTAAAEAVVHARTDVDRALVVKNSYFGPLAGRRAFARLLLPEISDGCRARPCCFVELAVDADRARQ